MPIEQTQLETLLPAVEADTAQFLELVPSEQIGKFNEIGQVIAGKRVDVPTREGMFAIVGEMKDVADYIDFTVAGNGTSLRYQADNHGSRLSVAKYDTDTPQFGDDMVQPNNITRTHGFGGAVSSAPRTHIEALMILNQFPDYIGLRESLKQKHRQSFLGRLASRITRH